jgi:hypothetical protein
MSDFEYLTVLIAIILGIGITHILKSLGRILGATKSLNISVAHLIWTANIVTFLVVFWWWGINLRELREWVFLQYFFLLFVTSLWCLLAALLYPTTIPKDYDLRAHFAEKRKAFFAILILLAITDPLTSMILGTEHLKELGWAYGHWILACFVGGILGFRYEDERLQQAVAIYWGLSMIVTVLAWQYSVGN